MLSGAAYYKLSDDQAITTSIRYFNLGTIQFVDYSGTPLASQSPREFFLGLRGYTRKLSDKMSLAVALRYINSKLATGDVNNSGVNYKAGTSVAGDISWYYNLGLGKNVEAGPFGVAITNLGSQDIAYTNRRLL